MKTLIILLTILLLTGCNNPKALTGKQMKEAITECEKNNLDYIALHRPFSNSPDTIVKIECQPKPKNK